MEVSGIVRSGLCVICQDQLLNTKGELTKSSRCSHIFHNNCLVTWMKEQGVFPTCPTCRKPITNRTIYLACSICGKEKDTEENKVIIVDPCMHIAHVTCLTSVGWVCPLDRRDVWLHF